MLEYTSCTDSGFHFVGLNGGWRCQQGRTCDREERLRAPASRHWTFPSFFSATTREGLAVNVVTMVL
jgi:hypothetical protein